MLEQDLKFNEHGKLPSWVVRCLSIWDKYLSERRICFGICAEIIMNVSGTDKDWLFYFDLIFQVLHSLTLEYDREIENIK